jgi:ABC-type transport system involved in multi-copper enzyme maturation permease subunit
MNRYIWEELKRIIIKKKIWIAVIFMVTIVFGWASTLKTNTLEVQIQKYKALLVNQKMGRDKADSELKKAEFSRDIVSTQKEIKDREEQLNEIKNYDRSKLDQRIQKLERENNPENEYKLLQLKYEKKYNIEKNELIPKGMYSAMEILAYFIPVFFLLILIVFLSDIVSGDYSPNTIKNLVTKPISRKKIIMSKFVAAIILSTGTLIVSTLIFILEGGIHLGISDLRLPFDVGAKYVFDSSLTLSPITSQMKYVSGSRSIIPLWSAIIELLLIAIIVSAAIISIILLISVFCRNSLVSSLVSFILIGGTAVWYLFGFAGRYVVSAKYGAFVKFLPIPYIVDVMGVLSGDISVQLTSTINVFSVLMVCLAWTSIMLFLSSYVFGKRDFD